MDKAMCWKAVEVIAEVFAAIGTVLVAVLAIWGDFFRYKLAGPQLKLSLTDPRTFSWPIRLLGGGSLHERFLLLSPN
jgi:hypothetical protein